MKESAISREIQDFLRTIGGAVYSTEQGFRKDRGGTRMTPGIPDLLVIFPTAWTFAEVKRAKPKGKLTEAQETFRDLAIEAGIPWQLWRDVRHAWDWAVEVGLIEDAETREAS